MLYCLLFDLYSCITDTVSHTTGHCDLWLVVLVWWNTNNENVINTLLAAVAFLLRLWGIAYKDCIAANWLVVFALVESTSYCLITRLSKTIVRMAWSVKQ